MSDVGDVGVIYFPSPSKHEVMVVMYSCTLTLVYYPREPVGEFAKRIKWTCHDNQSLRCDQHFRDCRMLCVGKVLKLYTS